MAVLLVAPVLAVVGFVTGCSSDQDQPADPTLTQSPCLWGQVLEYEELHPGFNTRVEAVEYYVAGIEKELAQLKRSPGPTQPLTEAEAVLALRGAEALLPRVFQREVWAAAGASFGEVEVKDGSGQKIASVQFEKASKGGYRIAQLGVQRPPGDC